MAYRRGDNDRPEVLGYGFIKAITWGQNMSREAMQMALEVLEILTDGYDGTEVGVEIEAITALRQALDTEQEPVAFINVEEQKLEWAKLTLWHTPTVVKLPKIPLYTAPPKREWVGLTDEEIWSNGSRLSLSERGIREFARAIEAKLKEKNQ
jgi:hypothetical protein